MCLSCVISKIARIKKKEHNIDEPYTVFYVIFTANYEFKVRFAPSHTDLEIMVPRFFDLTIELEKCRKIISESRCDG